MSDSTITRPVTPTTETVPAPKPSRFAAQLGLAIVILTLIVCFSVLAGASRGFTSL